MGMRYVPRRVLRRGDKRQRTRGMAMVEMIFVLPLLLLILFAIAWFSVMLSRWLTLSNAVREGARTLVVFRSPCDVGTVEGEVETAGSRTTSRRAGSISATSPSPTRASARSANQGTVTGTFNFPLNVPFWPGSYDIPLTYSSQMRVEGFPPPP